MVKVITYGTFDLLHYGHLRLLKRAKALGDYLIVGVTADDFDKVRGKINVKQSLMQRVEAVRSTGIADEIIIEEYEGQKIDDIKRYEADIFTVGSDWIGKFDYLNKYCKVIYLERTQGISSSELRSKERNTRLGLVGESNVLGKFFRECSFVNGIDVSCICSENEQFLLPYQAKDIYTTKSFEDLLEKTDAVYVGTHPFMHYEQCKRALEAKKHVLCESPLALTVAECSDLIGLARRNGLVLMDSIKTAYATAYDRLLLLLKSGKIGKIVSVDVTCTSLKEINESNYLHKWSSICAWGPTAMLPIFQILGTAPREINIRSKYLDKERKFDLFTKADFSFDEAVASFKVANGIKSEGQLIVSGTKGYLFVPAPWWKTDYFEIRYENQGENRRYFYQLDGEGIRYEIVAFLNSISTKKITTYVDDNVSLAIVKVFEDFFKGKASLIG